MDNIDDQGNRNGSAGQAQYNAVRRRVNRQGCAATVGGGDTYMECRRNFSLSAGRYTVDGCSEFLKSVGYDQNPMLCVACGCHRSFHRKVVPNHFRVDAPAPTPTLHYGFLLNEIPFVRRPRLRQGPLPAPQHPLPPIPQPEMPREIESEEEERSETDEDEEDEESEERSEIDSEGNEEEEEDDEMIDGEENDCKED